MARTRASNTPGQGAAAAKEGKGKAQAIGVTHKAKTTSYASNKLDSRVCKPKLATTKGKGKKVAKVNSPVVQKLQILHHVPKMSTTVDLPHPKRVRAPIKHRLGDGPRPYHKSDELTYGIQATAVVATASGNHKTIVAAKCLFCVAFG